MYPHSAVQKPPSLQQCAAIKDVFEETRSIPEPAGALGLAGLKAHIIRHNLQHTKPKFIAVVSGGNMNFGKLRFVAERAELGERREVLMCLRMPEQPGSFVKFHSLLDGRPVTELSYRFTSSSTGYIITSFLLKSGSSSVSGPCTESRSSEIAELIANMQANGIEAFDLSQDEFAKSHVRHLGGGRAEIKDERLFRFEFPERPKALGNFLEGLRKDLSITLFHYRNHGADVGKVLVGVDVPASASDEFETYLEELGYPYVEETDNEVYKMLLCS